MLKGFFRGPIEKLVYEEIKNGIPNKFNNFVQKTQGLFNLGENLPESFPPNDTYSSITFDFQLDPDIVILKDRMMFGINGTFYNKDKGYNIPKGLKEPNMPRYDPKIKSKFQLFVSNYLLETLFATALEKKPFRYELKAWKLNNRIAPFTSTTFEGVFPFLSSKFGKHIPMDLNMIIKKVYGVECFADNSTAQASGMKSGTI